ncbi:hypothetical protein BXY57_1761 [Thermoflavifilum aggregans]|uniref:Uncharacterized protein n=1 Tax=Thermoflavifilum aggregans TaxID=454188 RepID=A0A2M9CWA7_9BACT|nr:hypothetical protein [Thermoflavifilum aggregans]PJJ76157.1 hypothetical protein BXY57_1761 [Thermoflavifilum aggregans]
MDTTNTEKQTDIQNLDQLLKDLESQLKEVKPVNPEPFRDVFNRLVQYQRRFQQLLEWATDINRDNKDLQGIYREVAGWNASELVEDLKRKGYTCSSKIKKSFDLMGYRILEQVRYGKRDEVFHAILRIFMAAEEPFPKVLTEAFKPIYPDDLFKVFLFSFLSGVLNNQQKPKQASDQNETD